MNNNWLRKTLKDFAPYAVAPIHEKTVINANESYFNILSLPSVGSEMCIRDSSSTPRTSS